MALVSFSYADNRLNYKHKKELKKFIPQIFVSEGKKLNALQYVFCSDDYLLKINQEFLQHDDYTDIITFDLSDDSIVKGEIYISLERVQENAKMLSVAFEDELLRVVFHGALHLCGFKDKRKSEITAIRNREAYYMRLYKNAS